MYPDMRKALALLAVFGSLHLAAAVAQDDAATPVGELWETTSQTSMAGLPMKMPAMTFKVCVDPNSTAPPVANNEEYQCTMSEPQQDGLKVTWTSVCTGDMPMTGEGEINYEDDTMSAYSGQIRYASDEANVNIELSGHRVGSCDNPM